MGEVLRGDTWENVYGQDPVRALDYMKQKLGYAIQPKEFFKDWEATIHEERFNIPMISDTFGHFNQQLRLKLKMILKASLMGCVLIVLI